MPPPFLTAMDEAQTNAYVSALLEERRGYEQRGDVAGLKAVDAEIKRLTRKGRPPSARAERATPKRESR